MNCWDVMRKLRRPINDTSGLPVIDLGPDTILVGWGDKVAVFVGNRCTDIRPASEWPVPEDTVADFLGL